MGGPDPAKNPQEPATNPANSLKYRTYVLLPQHAGSPSEENGRQTYRFLSCPSELL
jgi:hypothetical protein